MKARRLIAACLDERWLDGQCRRETRRCLCLGGFSSCLLNGGALLKGPRQAGRSAKVGKQKEEEFKDTIVAPKN